MLSPSTTTQCPNCGSDKLGARFCTECGCPLSGAGTPASAARHASPPSPEPNKESALPPTRTVLAAKPSSWVVSSEAAAASVVPAVPEQTTAHLYAAHGGAGATILAKVLGHVDEGRWAGLAPEEGGAVLIGRTHAAGLDAVRQVLATSADVFTAVVLVPDAPGRLPRELRDQVTIIGGVLPVVRVPWVEEWRTGKTEPGSSAVTKFIDEYRKTVR